MAALILFGKSYSSTASGSIFHVTIFMYQIILAHVIRLDILAHVIRLLSTHLRKENLLNFPKYQFGYPILHLNTNRQPEPLVMVTIFL